jgi:hypothetical protein
MEVHHHSHHPKKWKEYVTEFIMLFAAVTLGFFAENLREVQVEKHREISYLKNVHEDLQLDFQTVDTVIKSNTYRLDMLDSLFVSINNNTVTNEDFYFYIRNLALRSTFESAHTGFDQIKSAGGLRMVQNKDITNGIQQYEKLLVSTTKLEETREKTIEAARFKMAAVLDSKTLYEMSINQTGGIIRFPKPLKAGPIIKNGGNEINELLNLVAIGLNTNRYLNERLNQLKKIGQQLDQAILKEYKEDLEH